MWFRSSFLAYFLHCIVVSLWYFLSFIKRKYQLVVNQNHLKSVTQPGSKERDIAWRWKLHSGIGRAYGWWLTGFHGANLFLANRNISVSLELVIPLKTSPSSSPVTSSMTFWRSKKQVFPFFSPEAAYFSLCCQYFVSQKEIFVAIAA